MTAQQKDERPSLVDTIGNVLDEKKLAWKPDHPGDPVGWWDCKKCGEDNNPPTLQHCMKCHARRPGSVSNPEPPAKLPKPKPTPLPPKDPSAPPPPAPPTNWKGIVAQIVAWGTVIATGLSIASFFIPALAPIASVIKGIIAALKGLPL
jgi:hypothetical protein